MGWKKAKYSFEGYIADGIVINNAIVCYCVTFRFSFRIDIFIGKFQFKGTAYRLETNLEYRVFGPREYSVDLCAFLDGTFTHILIDLVSAFMKRASKENNIFHSCPFSVSSNNYLFFKEGKKS